MVGYFWKLSYFRGYQDIFTRLSSSAVQCAGFSLQMSHSRLSHVVTAHSALSLESGEWLSSGVTNFQPVSADTHLVSVNTDNAPSINVLFPWYHRRRVCRLCPRPGYKGFWLNHSRSGCVTMDQSEAWCWAPDQWEALYHHSGISLV